MRFMNRRKKTVVDRRFQWRLVRRLVMHWFSFLFAVLAVLAGWHVVVNLAFGGQAGSGSFSDTLMRYAPLMFVLWVMLPIVAWDVLKLSHSIVGPILRIRGVLKSMNQGEYVQKITLRKGDFCVELADDLNRLIDTLNAERGRTADPDATECEMDSNHTESESSEHELCAVAGESTH